MPDLSGTGRDWKEPLRVLRAKRRYAPRGDGRRGTNRLPFPVLIGTHHKTGTMWMERIFLEIARVFGLDLFAGAAEDAPARSEIFLEHHSRFPAERLDAPHRGIHVIRDPRDVIVSGAFYHVKSDEGWLHVPREDLGGRTYAEAISGLERREDRILFEMEHAGGDTIRDMLAWDYGRPEFLEIRYEDLIVDEDLVLFHRIFTHLGFPGDWIPSLLAIARDFSLFSGKIRRSVHIRSGKQKQWAERFRDLHRRRFLELFGDALVRLGYEEDARWAEDGEAEAPPDRE